MTLQLNSVEIDTDMATDTTAQAHLSCQTARHLAGPEQSSRLAFNSLISPLSNKLGGWRGKCV